MDRFDKYLDIHKITEHQIDFKLLVDALLTKKQKLLLRYQRKKLIRLSDQDTSSDQNYSKAINQKFAREMQGFKTGNQLESMLLQGVIRAKSNRPMIK